MAAVEIIKFVKDVDGQTHECEIKRFNDGSVGVFGEEIDTWMFEFTDDALELAIAQVTEEGYKRMTDEPSSQPPPR